MPVIDIKKHTKLRMLISANPGMGKTTFCGTAEDDERSSPCLIVNFAGNPETLIKREKQPVVWQPDNMRQLEMLLTWIGGGQKKDAPVVQKLGLPEGVQYKTLCIDHLAEYQRLQMHEIEGKGAAGPLTDKKMEWDGWHMMLHRTVNLSRILSDPHFPVHTIQTVHLKSDIENGAKVFEPMLWGRSDYEVPGYVLAHAWLTWNVSLPAKQRDTNGAERVMVFKDLLRHVSLKEQYGGSIPTLVFDPTVPKLLDLIGAT